MAIITKTVGTAARQYSTLQSALDSLPADAVAAGNSYVIELYNDSLFVENVTFYGMATDATHTLTIRCAPGHSFRDHPNVRTNRLAFNQANGVAIAGTATDNYVLALDVEFLTLEGIQARSATGSSYPAVRTYAEQPGSGTIVRNVLADDSTNAVAALDTSSNATLLIDNCVCIGTMGYCGYDTGSIAVTNCTVVNNASVTLPPDWVAIYADTFGSTVHAVLKNNLILGFPVAMGSYLGAAADPAPASCNNATDCATILTGSSLTGLTITDQIVQYTTSGGVQDYRLKAGSSAVNAGVTLSNATDISGTARPQGAAWDIGAWEYSAPPSLLGPMKGLDLAFGGQPFVQLAVADDTTLDLAFNGQPFSAMASGVVSSAVAASQAQSTAATATLSTSSATVTAATSGAQSAAAAAATSASATVAASGAQSTAAALAISVSASVATSGAQSAAATAALSTSSGASVATSGAQSTAALATISSGVTAATSGAQSATGALAAITPSVTSAQAQSVAASAAVSVSAAAATSQGQKALAAAAVSLAATSTTSGAQSAAAAAALTTPWTFVSGDALYVSGSNTSVTMPAAALTAGNHSVVCVIYRRVGATTTTVTDSAGNTYTAGTQYSTGFGGASNDVWSQWFYSLAAPNGDAANVITVSFSTDAGAPSVHTMQFASAGLAAVDLSAQAMTATSAASVSSASFNTTGGGVIAVAEQAFLGDNSTSDGAFSAGYTLLPRASVLTAHGYRLTTQALSSQVVTYTATVGSLRTITQLVLKDATEVTGAVTTRQRQSAAAAAGVAVAASAATSGAQSMAGFIGPNTATATSAQAQTSAGAATVASAAGSASSQGQTSAAQVGLGASASAATAQAQASAAQLAAGVSGVAATSGRQSMAGQADLSLAGQSATSGAQSAASVTGIAVNSTAFGSHAQKAAATLLLLSGANDGISTFQAQHAESVAGVASAMAVATRQGQSAAAAAAPGIAAAASTSQTGGSMAGTLVPGIGLLSATSQQQGATAEAGIALDFTVASLQGQRVAVSIDRAADMAMATAQAQSSNSSYLSVGVDATVATGQSQQTSSGVLEQYIPALGTLAATVAVHPRLSAAIAPVRAALSLHFQTRAAVRGKVTIRPAP